MPRYRRPLRSDELYHWGTPKDTKYVAKIGEGEDARYFYSEAEYRAYQLGQGAKKGINSIKSGINNERKASEYRQKSDHHKRMAEIYDEGVRESKKLREKYPKDKNSNEKDMIDDSIEYRSGKARKEHALSDRYQGKYDKTLTSKVNKLTEAASDKFNKAKKTVGDIKKDVKDAKDYKKKIAESEHKIDVIKNSQKEDQRKISKAIKRRDRNVRLSQKYGSYGKTGSRNTTDIAYKKESQKIWKENDSNRIRRYSAQVDRYKKKYDNTIVGKAEKQINKGKNRVKKLLGK